MINLSPSSLRLHQSIPSIVDRDGLVRCLANGVVSLRTAVSGENIVLPSANYIQRPKHLSAVPPHVAPPLSTYSVGTFDQRHLTLNMAGEKAGVRNIRSASHQFTQASSVET